MLSDDQQINLARSSYTLEIRPKFKNFKQVFLDTEENFLFF